MATVKICDRCNKKIENRVFPLTLNTYRSVLKRENELFKYTYDLCDECTKRLLDFLNGEELCEHSET